MTEDNRIDEIIRDVSGGRIAIVGNGPSGSHCDYSEYPHPVWTVNGGWMHHKSSLGWVMDDIHGPALRLSGVASYEDQLDQIRDAGIPVITSTVYPGYPDLLEYPLRKILRHFDMPQPYFAETTCYMMAFAIYAGVKHIDLYGVDYINVRPAERAGFEYWCGVAKGRGIRVQITSRSHCLKNQALDGVNRHIPDLYGYLPRNLKLPHRQLTNGSLYVGYE